MENQRSDWRRPDGSASSFDGVFFGSGAVFSPCIRGFLCLALVFFSGILFLSCRGGEQGEELVAGADSSSRTLFDAARPCPEIPGAPRKSDVTMRSLFPRPMTDGGPHDTLEAIRRFHATWLEWTYLDDADGPVSRNGDFIRQVHELGAVFGGASAAGRYYGDEPSESWNVVDLEGEPVYATWMRSWARPNPWGCANNPEFRQGHLRYARRVIDQGADMLQRDEPRQNKLALRWGGCFCDHCMDGFNRWLRDKGDPEVVDRLAGADLEAFDYRQYLRERDAPVGDAFSGWRGDELKDYFEQFQVDSSIEFNKWWREGLNDHAGRHVVVSCNNGVRIRGEIEQIFDYWIGELHASNASPEFLYDAITRARAYGKAQNMTMPLYNHAEVTVEWVELIRKTLSATYAMGAHMEMPWDTYLPTPDAARFFGDFEDYADLTAFVHSISHYLDGYADAAAYGGEIRDDRWEASQAPVRVKGGDGLYAFARVRAQEPDSAVVVHLLDWRMEPGGFRVSVRPGALFGDRALSYRLYTPVPYHREAHEEAFGSGDYSSMYRREDLASGFVTGVEIPALSPWGVLVIEPGEELHGVWQPTIALEETPDDDYAHISIASRSEGAEIRYTLDGSEPGPDSPLYSEPLRLSSPTEVKARAVVGEESSPLASVRLERAYDFELLRPDDPSLAENLRLWLSADGIAEEFTEGQSIPLWKAKAGPDARTPDAELLDGRKAEAPTFSPDALNGGPAVRFMEDQAQLAIADFANEAMAGGGFTLLFLSNSDDSGFGLSGNRITGGGGVPRLYMTRKQFVYDELLASVGVRTFSGVPHVIAFSHDGEDTIQVHLDGVAGESRDNVPVAENFGGWDGEDGGHLVMPFWSEDEPANGDIGEIVVFDRNLSGEEIKKVSLYLGDLYDTVEKWVLR